MSAKSSTRASRKDVDWTTVDVAVATPTTCQEDGGTCVHNRRSCGGCPRHQSVAPTRNAEAGLSEGMHWVHEVHSEPS